MSSLYKDYVPALERLYGQDKDMIDRQVNRYGLLLDQFKKKFGPQKIHLFSSPGRIEIGGNHTDHNNGRVLSAAIHLDTIAVAAPNGTRRVRIVSEGYPRFRVSLDQLDIREQEYGTPTALVRGIAYSLKEHGHRTDGFDACLQSEVPKGSGLSSSASFEILISKIFNTLFNEDQIPPEEMAKYSQHAENVYFKKPCGLMDQLTCAMGGLLHIDFQNLQEPEVNKIDVDLTGDKYRILTVDTGGSHADLTADYAAIPAEMKSVAKALSAESCRDITLQQLRKRIKKLRNQVGDRAVLRAMHFLEENERVSEQVLVLEKGDFNTFLELVKESGNSSFKWLQNTYSTKKPQEQGLSLALALTEQYISEIQSGACRVHGGGFAGTILVFLPADMVKEYISLMESVFGRRSTQTLNIRPYGALVLDRLEKQ